MVCRPTWGAVVRVSLLPLGSTLLIGCLSLPTARMESPVPPAPAAPESARIPSSPLLPYGGRFADDPRFHIRVRELLRLVPGVLEFVGARLGVARDVPLRIRIRFVDGTSNRREDLHLAWVTREEFDGLPYQVINFRTESLIGGETGLEYLVGHEGVHCFQFQAFGGRLSDLPDWLVEGMADWGSGRGREALEAYYLSSAVMRRFHPVLEWIVGLDAPGEWRNYGESYLAFALLEERLGEAGVRSFLGELERVPDVDRALRLWTGRGLEPFVRESREWTTSRMKADLKDLPAYGEPKELFQDRRWEAAAEAYDRFLAGHPGSLFRPLAMAERAICRVRTGDIAGAEEDLAASIREDRGGGALTRTRRWVRMNIDKEAGRWEDVEREAGLFLFDYEYAGGMYLDQVYVLFRQARDELLTGTHRE